MLSEYFFTSREEASAAAADSLRDALQAELSRQDRAAVVLSGGSTPAATLRMLSRQQLAWDRITVTLSDERWVSADHDDSNERMLRATLLKNEACQVRLMPLFREDVAVAEAPIRLQQDFDKLPLPFASTLLGMGEDGHFASLFPDFEGLNEALQEVSDTSFVTVTTAASPHPRISMTLSGLLCSREIILLIFGAGKRRVYEDAKSGSKLPIARLIAQARVPLRVVWAP